MPRKPHSEGQDELFPSADFETGAPLRFKELSAHLWTENKAKLIARYLREFVFVTKHGTYIDLFAGRQSDDLADGWSAEQVLQMQPSSFKLRHYRLFELEPRKVTALEELMVPYAELDITVAAGDSNQTVIDAIPAGSISEKEATFCLIDQRTTECKWSTCVHLSQLKPAGYKPELFYFFAQAWFDRALATRTTEQSIQGTRDWWGRDDWTVLVGMGHFERALLLSDRFKQSLGYKYATPWPIRSDRKGGRVMFYMVHATDHDRAPALMRRAYEWAVAPIVNPDDEEQLSMELGALEY